MFWALGAQYVCSCIAVTCMEQLNAQKLSANQGKIMKVFCYFCSYSLVHSFLSYSFVNPEDMFCLYYYYFKSTHLGTWCRTGRDQCWPGEGEQARTVKKWTHPWSVSSVLLICLCSHHGPEAVRPACCYCSAKCCECMPQHLHGEDRWRDGEGQV